MSKQRKSVTRGKDASDYTSICLVEDCGVFTLEYTPAGGKPQRMRLEADDEGGARWEAASLLLHAEVEQYYREQILWYASSAAVLGVLCPLAVAFGLQASAVVLALFAGVDLWALSRHRRRLKQWQAVRPLAGGLRLVLETCS